MGRSPRSSHAPGPEGKACSCGGPDDTETGLVGSTNEYAGTNHLTPHWGGSVGSVHRDKSTTCVSHLRNELAHTANCHWGRITIEGIGRRASHRGGKGVGSDGGATLQRWGLGRDAVRLLSALPLVPQVLPQLPVVVLCGRGQDVAGY